jgi:16S rRNA (uracil1498-N3)-methyltransferase
MIDGNKIKGSSMELKRFFIDNLDLKENNTYELGKDEHNYMINVMRLKVQDKFVLNNNTMFDFFCSIQEIGKNKLTIFVEKQVKNENEPNCNVTLCQALVKGDKFEFITQKIVELGVTKLIPFTSAYTVVKEHTHKTARLQKIAEQASSQCGRSKTLSIADITSINKLPSVLTECDLVLLAYEKETNSLSKVLKESNHTKNIALIVGSEGGFREDEVAFLEKNITNLKTVGLGRRILRAETASIVLSAITMYEQGELN